MNKPPSQPERNGRQWLVNDIAGLSQSVTEIDPSKYVDEQAEDAYEHALAKWPVMGRLMGLTKAQG